MQIQKNVSLAPLTTFQIGGNAKEFVAVSNMNELQDAIDYARESQQKFFILAGGSNILFSDQGFNGLVIHITASGIATDANSGMVAVESGANLLDVINMVAVEGLGGWESMAGIPGTVGGAVRGNAGAFGTEVVDVVTQVTAFHAETAQVKIFTKDECQFAYRNSFFKQNPEWIILAAKFQLTKGDQKDIEEKIANTVAEREKRHLQDVRAAGSFFMNPEAPEDIQKEFEHDKGVTSRGGRVPAGWLIEQVEMKGKQIGGAECSQQHPNYIVNKTGAATAEEVIMLSSMIKMRVRDFKGVQLREEVTMAGF